MMAAVKEHVGDLPIRCHFHNTRNTGLANAQAAVEAGVTSLGCEYRRHWWLPVCAGSYRQYSDRRSALPA